MYIYIYINEWKSDKTFRNYSSITKTFHTIPLSKYANTSICHTYLFHSFVMIYVYDILQCMSVGDNGVKGSTDWSGNKLSVKCKGKAVPLQAWSRPEGSRKLKFPGYMTTAQDCGKVVGLTHRPPLPPRKCSW
jgi:hypothetical protein